MLQLFGTLTTQIGDLGDRLVDWLPCLGDAWMDYVPVISWEFPTRRS
jgi:hypothetical protein